MDFTLEKCKTKAGYTAKFNKKIDLSKIRKKFEVVLDTPILVVIKVEGVEIVVHKFGEALFKRCEDVELMKKIASMLHDE